MSLLAQINAPHFCAGIVLENDRVVKVPPILNYMWGWHRDYVRNYCDRKHWTIKVVTEFGASVDT
jgi:hypothetical protein